MALLQGPVYEAYRAELLKRYKLLLRSLGKNLPKDKIKLVRDAFDMAARAHEGTVRKSGEPYIFHPLAVAEIAVTELGLGVTSVVCALLHDVVEDTDITLEDIEHRFGKDVANIIHGLTKISTVFENVDKDHSIQAENFKKMLLTLGDDLKVILIKLCDRLHNMRTLGSVSENTKLKIASETLFIYAPLAHRLGLNAIKTEMEDLSLKFTNPVLYRDISDKLVETKNVRQRYVKEFIDPLKSELEKSGLNIVEIKGRPKSIFSIVRKMEDQQIPFEEVYDAFAIRVIVDSPLFLEKADCWRVYSIVTDKYRSHTNRLRDWLSHPKSNGYSALHTTVLGPKGRWVEVQIRSKRMDDIAERGLAAHWRYKSGGKSVTTPQDMAFDNWLDAVKDTLSNSDLSALDLVSEFRTSLLGEEIYIFTPKGDVKSLPAGSTALDFGFAIHTELGKRTLGAKVNNKLVSIQSPLKNGDIVEILTTSKSRVTRDWLDVAKTARAKSKIREALKAERTQKANQGKLLLERLFRKHQLNFTDSNIKKLMHHFKYQVGAEFFHSVAEGQIRLNRELLLKIVLKKQVESSDSPKTLPSKSKAKPSAKHKNSDQIIIGEDYEMPYALSKCCHPVPGDPIFGFITVGEGIKIHRTTCPNATRLMSQYGYRIIPAQWRGDGYQKAFDTAIAVRGIDDVGIVSRITDIISKDMEVNMRSINISSNEDGTFGGKIEVMIYDLLHLEQLIAKIKATHKYIEVMRED